MISATAAARRQATPPIPAPSPLRPTIARTVSVSWPGFASYSATLLFAAPAARHTHTWRRGCGSSASANIACRSVSTPTSVCLLRYCPSVIRECLLCIYLAIHRSECIRMSVKFICVCLLRYLHTCFLVPANASGVAPAATAAVTLNHS